MDDALHLEVVRRAGGHCEVMAPVRGRHTRCGRQTHEVHHKLTRSRGGNALDDVGETYHLICICRAHHDWVHHNPADATKTGLYILGMAWMDLPNPVYSGPDEYLTRKYPL